MITKTFSRKATLWATVVFLGINLWAIGVQVFARWLGYDFGNVGDLYWGRLLWGQIIAVGVAWFVYRDISRSE